MAGGGSRPGEMIQGINVTPLVDVVLVLLIAVMVTASYAVSKTLPMDLPQAATGETQAHPMAISIDQGGGFYFDGRAVSASELRRLVQDHPSAAGKSALIAADASTQHRNVVQVIDLLRSEGVQKFAINVSPSDISKVVQ